MGRIAGEKRMRDHWELRQGARLGLNGGGQVGQKGVQSAEGLEPPSPAIEIKGTENWYATTAPRGRLTPEGFK